MFSPELLAFLRFTPVTAGVIFIPSLIVMQSGRVRILRQDNLHQHLGSASREGAEFYSSRGGGAKIK